MQFNHQSKLIVLLIIRIAKGQKISCKFSETSHGKLSCGMMEKNLSWKLSLVINRK